MAGNLEVSDSDKIQCSDVINEPDKQCNLKVIPCEISENNNSSSNLDATSKELDEELERKHFQRIVNAFRSYKFVLRLFIDIIDLNILLYN